MRRNGPDNYGMSVLDMFAVTFPIDEKVSVYSANQSLQLLILVLAYNGVIQVDSRLRDGYFHHTHEDWKKQSSRTIPGSKKETAINRHEIAFDTIYVIFGRVYSINSYSAQGYVS